MRSRSPYDDDESLEYTPSIQPHIQHPYHRHYQTMLPFLALLCTFILTLCFALNLLAEIHDIKEELKNYYQRTKLLQDEVKRMQRWILNHRYLEPGARIVRLPED